MRLIERPSCSKTGVGCRVCRIRAERKENYFAVFVAIPVAGEM